MKRRIFAWILLIGFVFVMVNVTLFFLNIHLSELHSLIMKISAVIYIVVLLILLIFKVRDDIRKRNQNELDMMLNNANNDVNKNVIEKNIENQKKE